MTSQHGKKEQSERHPKIVVEEVDENSEDVLRTKPNEQVTATVEEPQEVIEQRSHNDWTDPAEDESHQVEILQRKKRRDSTIRQPFSENSSAGRCKKLRSRESSFFMGEPFGQLESFFGGFGPLWKGFDSFDSLLSGMSPLGSGGDLFGDDIWGSDNVQMYSYSSYQSIGPDGRLREQKTSSKRVGDLKETTRMERDTQEGKEEVSYSREKGDRGKEARQRRDKSGKIFKEDKYYNMTPEEAEQFEQEWKTFAGNNHRNLSRSRDGRALGYRPNKME
ncbi:hypothetical protein Gasu2_44540 [Galdieria sulphuraria]|uniref:Myeloid leukemia factor n=1 Tax=Galdieria sulphuraria TaxID=130081 RepID=M2X4V6_GALSU|nr:uncharacterized protein Gasu_11730 [Galdieria sulphuraria]EME31495.1 hypothetical protein Gasu_11730 [Galdieria sulphuraria]GJD10252.1 hypothetical protein Gasu2_44540 [Galdieria sulphuraria]|eukprot:XP_005708015.1 hypothetical protein Gasu_11730 [Galdieria sulphuraria]